MMHSVPQRPLIVAIGVVNFVLAGVLAAAWWQGLLLGFVVVAVLWWATRPQPSGEAVPPPSFSDARDEPGGARTERFPALLEQVVPLWNRHVTLAQGHVKEAVDALVLRFSSLAQRLGGNAGDDGREAIALNTIETAEQGLQGIIDTLNKTQGFREALIKEISGVAAYSESLRKMAEDVASIAKQTNLLALNAAIEAARAGEAGRGFAVVADEVRKLSSQSGETGQRIRDTVASVSSAIEQAQALSAQFADEEERLVGDSRRAAQQIVTDFNATAHTLQASVESLREEQRGVESDIREVLVNLQFQDRVQQILDHVVADMSRLADSAQAVEQGRGEVPDVAHWMEELSRSYTMLEQHQVHHGKASGASAAPPASDITFF